MQRPSRSPCPTSACAAPAPPPMAIFQTGALHRVNFCTATSTRPRSQAHPACLPSAWSARATPRPTRRPSRHPPRHRPCHRRRRRPQHRRRRHPRHRPQCRRRRTLNSWSTRRTRIRTLTLSCSCITWSRTPSRGRPQAGTRFSRTPRSSGWRAVRQAVPPRHPRATGAFWTRTWR